MATEAPAKRSEDQPLKRVITRPLLTIFILGNILGRGIYALVGEVGGEERSGPRSSWRSSSRCSPPLRTQSW